MKPRNPEAARIENDYLERVAASQSNEVLQSIREHIEEALSENIDAGSDVTLVQMANVLEQLGPPESYLPQETAPNQEAVPHFIPEVKNIRLSKLALVSALCLPIAILTAILVGFIVHKISGDSNPSESTAWIAILSGTSILFIGLILGISARKDINEHPEELSGKGLTLIGILQLPIVWVFLFMHLFSSSAGPSTGMADPAPKGEHDPAISYIAPNPEEEEKNRVVEDEIETIEKTITEFLDLGRNGSLAGPEKIRSFVSPELLKKQDALKDDEMLEDAGFLSVKFETMNMKVMKVHDVDLSITVDAAKVTLIDDRNTYKFWMTYHKGKWLFSEGKCVITPLDKGDDKE